MTEYLFTIPKALDLTRMKQIVAACENEIYFESEEGDRIALKSTLGQLIFFSMFHDLEFLHTKSHLRCFGKKDKERLSEILTLITDESR
ncbi:MAG: hypothetical protein LKF52_11220 [Butyrivibrio sp.]|jgi:hypothetical protein|nr:hypothetical protein [Butyrivibrio sp.]